MQKPSLSVFPRHGSLESAGAESSPSASGRRSPERPALRISPERVAHELDRAAGALQPRTVAVRLATIIPLLLDAVEHNRTWLSDFADDTVRLDADLYEVLLAYQELRQGAAA